MEGQKIRDIIIGVSLMLVGVVTLLHTLGIFVFDEEKIALFASIGLLGLGVVLLVSYLFSKDNIWVFILALCMFFIAGMVYILNLMPGQSALIGVLLFGILALAFILVFISNPKQWWAMLVGWICLGLAGTVYTASFSLNLNFLPAAISNRLPPLVLFSSIFLGFIFVWLMKPRERWWSLLTAGMIGAVETVIYMSAIRISEIYIPISLFLVAGVTFLLVFLLSNKEYDLKWAIYPSIVLMGFSAFLYLITFWNNNGQLVISLMFLGIGGLFIVNFVKDSMMSRDKSHPPVPPQDLEISQKADEELISGNVAGVPSEGFTKEERATLLSSENDRAHLEEAKPAFPPVDYPTDDDETDK